MEEVFIEFTEASKFFLENITPLLQEFAYISPKFYCPVGYTSVFGSALL
jgi:hypothetical protein